MIRNWNTFHLYKAVVILFSNCNHETMATVIVWIGASIVVGTEEAMCMEAA